MKKMTPEHLVTKLLKTRDKEKNLKAAKEKTVLSMVKTKIRMTFGFSLKAVQWEVSRETSLKYQKKSLSTCDSISIVNIFQKWRKNNNFFQM